MYDASPTHFSSSDTSELHLLLSGAGELQREAYRLRGSSASYYKHLEQTVDVFEMGAVATAPRRIRSGDIPALGHPSGALPEVVSQPSRLGSTGFSIRTSGTPAPPVASTSRSSGRNPYAV